MRICPQSGTESQVGQNSKEEIRTSKVALRSVSQACSTPKVGLGGRLHGFLKVGGAPGRSSWGHLGSKVVPKGDQDAIKWPCQGQVRAQTTKLRLARRVFHEKVYFAKCMKNTMKIPTFSRFEGSWPVKLEPLGQPKGGQDRKSCLGKCQLGGQDGQSGPGKGQWTFRFLQPGRKASGPQVTAEVKAYLSSQPYD